MPAPSILSNRLRTWGLMAALAALLVAVGGILGGTSGMVLAFGFALVLNGVVYWTSDSLALRANGARELGADELPELRATVARLAADAGIPTPRLYLVDRPEPNAFATGRSPSRAAVAVTTGLLALLDRRQLEGVLAHELMHVRNRDTLVGTIAATFGGAISFLAQMAMFSSLFGNGDDESANPLALLGAILLAPLAATIIQLAVSRGREHLADATGADLTGDPEGLAQALERLAAWQAEHGLAARFRRARGRPADEPAMNPGYAHLYLVNPLGGRDLGSLFSTHPPLEARIARLRSMRAGRAAPAVRVDGRPVRG
jgi:heat shock protein HtpX